MIISNYARNNFDKISAFILFKKPLYFDAKITGVQLETYFVSLKAFIGREVRPASQVKERERKKKNMFGFFVQQGHHLSLFTKSLETDIFCYTRSGYLMGACNFMFCHLNRSNYAINTELLKYPSGVSSIESAKTRWKLWHQQQLVGKKQE